MVRAVRQHVSPVSLVTLRKLELNRAKHFRRCCVASPPQAARDFRVEVEGIELHTAAVSLLEVFAESARVPFDRSEVATAIAEATRATPGETPRIWAQRLMEVGDSLSLRIRWAECSMADALAFVGQRIPVAATTGEKTPDGEPTWIVMLRVVGSKVEWVRTDNLSNVRRSSKRSLQRKLGTTGRTVRNWVIAQPAMACTYTEPGGTKLARPDRKSISPLRRLLSLLAVERRDIWAIIIYSIFVGLLALATPIAVEGLVTTVAFGRYLQPVVVLALILFVFLTFAATLRGLMFFMTEIMQRRLFIRVVEDLAFRLPRARFKQWDDKHGPELVNRFFDIVTVQKVVATLLLDGIAIVLQTVIGMVVLAFYHPFLLGFDFAILVFLIFTIFILGRGAVKTSIYESKAKYAVADWLQELTATPTAFKLHGGQQFALDRSDGLAIDWIDARRRHFRIVMRQVIFALGLQAAAATVLLGLGGWLVIIGQLSLGQLVAAELIITVIVGAFAKLGKHMESYYDLLASVDKLGTLFDLQTEPSDRVVHPTATEPAAVMVRDLSIRVGQAQPIKDFSLHIKSGENIAITGPAGSGKSILIEALAGLREPSTGRIEFDCVDLRELRAESFRQELGFARLAEVVPGSVSENVHLYRPQLNALDVRAALEQVNLLEAALALQNGLDTKLLPSGAPLSSGQAARLMVARAIAARPRLLLIDGTLDSLPSNEIESIMDSLTKNGTPWTLVIVSNRPEVLASCSRTIELNKAAQKKQLVE